MSVSEPQNNKNKNSNTDVILPLYINNKTINSLYYKNSLIKSLPLLYDKDIKYGNTQLIKYDPNNIYSKFIILNNKKDVSTQTNSLIKQIKYNDTDLAFNAIDTLLLRLNLDVKKMIIKERLISNLLEYTQKQLPGKIIIDTREIITIDENINNLDDIILIAKKYKNDTRRFSINMDILRDLINPLEKLKNIIGMDLVKEQIIDQILSSLQDLYDDDQRFHTVIQGPPGVGKTMLAKHIGEIYLKMGILKNSSNTLNFNIARRSDLIGRFLGHTAKQTQNMIDKAEGGVLFIDEVYSLGNSEKRDNFSKECIDTINFNLTEKKNFVCIIAGYSKDIESCFFAYNQGLKRRFPFIYDIEKYSSQELTDIFISKINNCKWKLDVKINNIWISNFIDKNIEHFPYYGGDIDTLLLNCKTVHGRRIFGKCPTLRKIITKEDILNGFDKYLESKQKNKKNNILHNMYI